VSNDIPLPNFILISMSNVPI